MRLPSLNALRAFEAAARHQSILRAAEELCVSQGAVSRHVKLLEEDLGVQLFRRLPRGIELTEQGRRFLPVLTDAFEAIVIGARQISSSKQELRIICPPTLSIRWLVPRLGRFKERYPDIQVRLTTAMYEWEDFLNGDYDLGFDCGDPHTRPSGLEAVTVLPEIMMPVCAPALLQGSDGLREPADLAKVTLLHSTPDHRDWTRWLQAFGVKGVDSRSGEVFPSLDMAVKAAALGQGVTIGDLILTAAEIERGEVVMPFAEMRLETDFEGYCLYGPAGCWTHPKIAAFKTWILEEAVEA